MTIPSFSRLFNEGEMDQVMKAFSVRSGRSSDSEMAYLRKLNKNSQENSLPTPTYVVQR